MQARLRRDIPWDWVCAGPFAWAVCVVVSGYSFLAGNHEVYLLEPVRRATGAFADDWFVTQTMQYHGIYAVLAAWILRGGEAVAVVAFWLVTAALVGVVVWAWATIVRSLGGGVTALVGSVVAYHLLLGDRALGFYSLVQDGQFNAGNVAAAGLLAAIALHLRTHLLAAGIAIGVAGLFHLNYAVLGVPLILLMAWQRHEITAQRRISAVGLAWAGCGVNVLAALPGKLRESEAMELSRFIDVYVRLRHPHHYEPGVWPWWVWAAFLLPVPLAVGAAWARRSDVMWRRAAGVWLFLMGLQALALVSAGIWWWGETFVQLSLWRFSPHAKVLAVSAAVVGVTAMLPRYDAPREGRWLLRTIAAAVFVTVAWLSAAGRLPMPFQPAPPRPVLEAAAWAREHTPADAVFLVPPDASAFPLHARRGTVVIFKAVPQLSGELEAWATRMQDVLDVEDVADFRAGVRGYRRSRQAMRDRFAWLPPHVHAANAQVYGARYVLVPPAARWDDRSAVVVWQGYDPADSDTPPWALYDLRPSAAAEPSEDES